MVKFHFLVSLLKDAQATPVTSPSVDGIANGGLSEMEGDSDGAWLSGPEGTASDVFNSSFELTAPSSSSESTARKVAGLSPLSPLMTVGEADTWMIDAERKLI